MQVGQIYKGKTVSPSGDGYLIFFLITEHTGAEGIFMSRTYGTSWVFSKDAVERLDCINLVDFTSIELTRSSLEELLKEMEATTKRMFQEVCKVRGSDTTYKFYVEQQRVWNDD